VGIPHGIFPCREVALVAPFVEIRVSESRPHRAPDGFEVHAGECEIDRRAVLVPAGFDARIEAATPLPLIDVDRAAGAARDRADMHVAVIDVPAAGAFGISAAGKGGYSNEVSPDLSTFRTVFRDTFRSRAISLIVLPLMKCSRRIRAIVSTISIPDHLLRYKAGRATAQSIGGQFCRPNDKRT
jgi:hypothetical protein